MPLEHSKRSVEPDNMQLFISPNKDPSLSNYIIHVRMSERTYQNQDKISVQRES